QFHRVDDSLTASQPGSGLGLSIARRLLTDLGGAIVHEPREGGGSCFIVTIPQL
ncbi:MAG: two-component sensor histidine kinase, partial [Desulfobacterales bacterium]|nr:two-component sensor histidine kinase [Desulfobacterales bacterium]